MPASPPIATALVRWFRAAARPFPWRDAPHGERDPWRVLVSETMAQQTQIARVAERFPGFLRRFPSPRALAAAPESDVLAAWAGLGYYRRAANLHRAARLIVSELGGEFPRTAADLRRLPGVGRYTAGAVASLAFGASEPVVDGNVARVLLRLHGKPLRSDEPRAVRWAWATAGSLVNDAASHGIPAGELNEAIMELGATVCTPAAPRCADCPIAATCRARRLGRQSRIPRPKARPSTRPIAFTCLVLADPRGRILVERASGLWAGLWQPLTLDSDQPPPSDLCAQWLNAGRVHRTLTHRRVEFRVFAGRTRSRRAPGVGRRWVSPGSLDALGVSSAHRLVFDAGLAVLAVPTGTAPRRSR